MTASVIGTLLIWLCAMGFTWWHFGWEAMLAVFLWTLWSVAREQ